VIEYEVLKNKINSIMESRHCDLKGFFKEMDNYVYSVESKYLIPTIYLISFKGFGGDVLSDEVLEACFLVEDLHKWSQVLDDMFDNDNKRHGTDTVHVKYGTHNAVMYANLLMANAMLRLTDINEDKRTKIKHTLLECLSDMCYGEKLDIETKFYEFNDVDVARKIYRDIVIRKTGGLPKIASRIGGIMANNDNYKGMDDYMEEMAYFGQRCDDIYDFVKKEDIQREPCSDLINEKLTYPYIACLEMESEDYYKKLRKDVIENKINKQDVIHLLFDIGVVDHMLKSLERDINKVKEKNIFKHGIAKEFYDNLPHLFLTKVKNSIIEVIENAKSLS